MAGGTRRRKRVWTRKRAIQNWVWIAAVGVAAALFLRPARAWHSACLDDAVSAFGFFLILVGVWIRVCARGWKYEAEGRGMVTDGLYGCVRHPLYLGSFVIGLGLCAIAASYILAIVFVISFWISHGLVLRGEEAYLAREWPERFAAFQAATPAVFPRLKALFNGRSILPRRVWGAIVREADAACLWPLIGLGLETWKETSAPDAHHAVRLVVLLAAAALVGIAWGALRYEWSRSRRYSSAAAPAAKG